MSAHIRDERPEDVPAIYRVTQEAFSTVSYASGTEQDIVDALRSEGALVVSLVAVREGAVIGHVAFSPLHTSFGSDRWYALGPVSVLPDFQKMGIGSRLIREGLDRLRKLGGEGCALVGNPNYYNRFGFVTDSRIVLDSMPADASLILRFRETDDSGVAYFHETFFRTYPK